MKDALAFEGTEDGDDIEKGLFQPLPCLLVELNTPSSPPPPGPPPSERTEHSGSPVNRAARAKLLARCAAVASGQKAQTLKKKLRSKEHKKQQRERRAADLPFGSHRKTRSSTSHLLASSPWKTPLRMQNLRVTKTGYTTIRDREIIKVERTLGEMVGKNSEFRFELKEWDGW